MQNLYNLMNVNLCAVEVMSGKNIFKFATFTLKIVMFKNV